MPSIRRQLSNAVLVGLWGLMLLVAQGCQAPQRTLDPDTLRSSSIAASEQEAALRRWQLAIDFANEFLASSFNRTLPRDARMRLDPDGMRLITSERAMPVRLVLIDDYRTSSCVCATVDTYKDVVYVFRPWGADLNLPIVTCNTFFTGEEGAMDRDVDLATRVLRLATILYFEKHAHISTWEWFKCQWLEWLIGSSHHAISMQRPSAVHREVFYFWHGIDPAPPSVQRILAARAKAEGRSAVDLAERSRKAAQWREQFEQYLRGREAVAGEPDPGAAGHSEPARR